MSTYTEVVEEKISKISEANWKTNPIYGKIADLIQGAMDDEFGDSNATSLAIILEIIVPILRSFASALHKADCERFTEMIGKMEELRGDNYEKDYQRKVRNNFRSELLTKLEQYREEV